jgi:hypothetical protein
MLDENLVLTLLQASITGAGLVLAVYALIVPLSRRFFSYRADEVLNDLEKLKEKASQTDTSISQDDLKDMRDTLDRIEGRKDFPTYLGVGAGFVFFLYILSAFMSIWWVLNWNRAIMESLPLVFGFATFLFLLMGLFSIKDISQTMKKEFGDLKKQVTDKAKSKGIAVTVDGKRYRRKQEMKA